MIPIPDPLHPAIVHFPIVLIFVGTVAAVAAIFIRRWHLSLLAAILLAGGAVGAFAATWSGDREEEMAGQLPAQTKQILDNHEEWGELARNLAFAAAFLAGAAIAAKQFPKTAKALSFATALVAAASMYATALTGHYGGLLVYKNGVGVKTAAGNAPPTPADPAKGTTIQEEHEH